MRYLITLIFWFTLLISYSQNRSWHKAPDGNVVKQWLQYDEDYFYYKDRLYTGFAFELHKNNNLKAEFQFKDGIKISEKRWLKNGELDYDYKAEIDEKKNSISEYKNGSLVKQTFVKKGLETISYYENNIKTSETEELIKDSVVVEKKWDKNGVLIEKSVLKKGKYSYNKNGPSTMWYKNGNKMFECNYRGEWYGGTTGKQITYYNNGKMAVSGEVNDLNQKETWSFFDEKQNIRVKEICLNDSLRNRKFNFYSKEGVLLSDHEIRLGKDYRTIKLYDFTKEYPLNVDLPINHPDISITNLRTSNDSLSYYYQECVELKKRANFIKIEFFDEGCGGPFTSFSFRDKNNNEIFKHKNYSLGQRHLVISDTALLSKTRFIYHSTCEGGLIHLVALYE